MRKRSTKNKMLKTDIDSVFKNGKSFVLNDIKMKVKENVLCNSRVLITFVKNYGNAVKRNTIRRRLKEIFRLNKEVLKKNYDLIFIAYKNVHTSYTDLERDILQLFKKANL